MSVPKTRRSSSSTAAVQRTSPASARRLNPASRTSAALRHLVNERLSEEELRAVYAAGRSDLPPRSWDCLVSGLTTDHSSTYRHVTICAPEPEFSTIAAVLTPITHSVTTWDGQLPLPAADVLVVTLPWRLHVMDELTEAYGQPGIAPVEAHHHTSSPRQLPAGASGRQQPPADDEHPAHPDAALSPTVIPPILPVAFADRTVTIGPMISPDGPCPRCVQPALTDVLAPDPSHASVLTALAAGGVGLFLRSAGAQAASGALSLTFSSHSPHVVHRLWTCTPHCQSAA